MQVRYRSRVAIRRGEEGKLTAYLPGGEVPSFRPHPVAEGEGEEICSTLDHVVAAAGW